MSGSVLPSSNVLVTSKSLWCCPGKHSLAQGPPSFVCLWRCRLSSHTSMMISAQPSFLCRDLAPQIPFVHFTWATFPKLRPTFQVRFPGMKAVFHSGRPDTQLWHIPCTPEKRCLRVHSFRCTSHSESSPPRSGRQPPTYGFPRTRHLARGDHGAAAARLASPQPWECPCIRQKA